jgi:hypothetical protein
VLGGNDPADASDWMWDLTVPGGGGDHDFYIDTTIATVLVHNCDDPELDEMGEEHMREGHFPGGSAVDSSKGIFNADEDPYALVDNGAGSPIEGPNENGFYERLVNAGRIVGNASQDSGGLTANIY